LYNNYTLLKLAAEKAAFFYFEEPEVGIT